MHAQTQHYTLILLLLGGLILLHIVPGSPTPALLLAVVFVPLDAVQHEPLVLLGGLGPALHNHQVKVRGRENAPRELELLRVNVNLVDPATKW